MIESIEILEKLGTARKYDNQDISIQIIWYYAYKLLQKENKKEYEALTIQICKSLTESVVVSNTFLKIIENLYYFSIDAKYNGQTDEYSKNSKIINELIHHPELTEIKKRINKKQYKNDHIYLAQGEEGEFFIDKEGKLRKNLIPFDHWYENDKDTIINYYKNSIENIFKDTKGNLVFIDKQIGNRGPILLKDFLENEFKDLGIITIKNKQIDYKNIINNSKYCILDDVIYDGCKNIDKYIKLLDKELPNIEFNTSIVLYNNLDNENEEMYNKKSLSLIDVDSYERIIRQNQIEEPVLIGDSTTFEAIMFGIGSAIGLGDVELGLKFKKYARNNPWRFGNKKLTPKHQN